MRMFHRSQLVALHWFPDIKRRTHRRGQLQDATFEPGALSVPLYDRTIGVAAEVDDHLSARRIAGTRVPIAMIPAPRPKTGGAA